MTRWKFTCCFILFSFTGLGLMAQSQWRAWLTGSVEAALSPKLDLRVTYLRSHDISNTWNNNFNQKSLSAGYDLSRRWSVLGGYLQTGFPSTQSSTNRSFLRVGYKFPVAGLFSISNSIQGEWFSANETRFRNRFIWISRIGNKKRIPFLNLNLSASYWLYYNMGGNTIRYYDAAGSVLVRQSPDGLHRGRLYLNASSKISKNWFLSLYYMRQTEFNLFSTEFRKINVLNPATGKTSRAFDNYNVAGISLSYAFKTYKDKKPVKKNKTQTDKNKSYEQQN